MASEVASLARGVVSVRRVFSCRRIKIDPRKTCVVKAGFFELMAALRNGRAAYIIDSSKAPLVCLPQALESLRHPSAPCKGCQPGCQKLFQSQDRYLSTANLCGLRLSDKIRADVCFIECLQHRNDRSGGVSAARRSGERTRLLFDDHASGVSSHSTGVCVPH